MEKLTLYMVCWIGIAIVNVMVGKEKGINAGLLILPSLIAAPFLYLYVLAIPKLGKKE